jgi:O-antigen ligase
MITTAALASLSMVQLVTHNFSQNFFGLSQIVMDQVFGDALTPRVGGPINAPNLWGQVLAAVSTLIIFRIIHEKGTLVKLGALLMFIVISYVILNTYSRGAYLVFVLDIVLILFVFEKRFNPLIAFAGLAILILLLPFVPATYRDRFDTLAFFGSQNGIYQDTSFRGRTSEMLTGLSMFTTHPILGVGTANYYNNYQQYAQLVGIEFRATARDPHSLYIQVLAETGILGAITFFGLVFALLRALNKTYRAIERSPGFADWLPWINAIRMAILSYLMTSVFLHNAYIRYFWILVAMALASIQITYNMLSNKERSLSPEVHR